jgi:hypothetical protein
VLLLHLKLLCAAKFIVLFSLLVNFTVGSYVEKWGWVAAQANGWC